MEKPRVLIVGGGLAGICLAYLLSLNRIPFLLVERRNSLMQVGAGIVINPNGMLILDALGIGDAIRANGQVLEILQIKRHGCEMSIPLAEVWKDAGVQPVAIERQILWDLLLNANQDCPLQCSFGLELHGLELSQDKVIASFSDGSSIEAELLVAADGVNSTVRRIVYPLSYASPTPWIYLRFLSENCISFPNSHWLVKEEENCTYGLVSVGKDRVHCFVQLRRDTKPQSSINLNDFHDCLLRRNREFARLYEARISNFHLGGAEYLASPMLGIGRVAFIGDAAHAVSPTLSLGAALGFEDSVVLTRELLRNIDIKTVVRSYSTARLTLATKAANMSNLASQAVYHRQPSSFNNQVAIGLMRSNVQAFIVSARHSVQLFTTERSFG